MRDQYERELVKSQMEKKRMQNQYHLEQIHTYEGNGGAANDDDAYRGEQMQPVPPPPQSSPPYHHAPQLQLSSESVIRQDQHAEMLIDEANENAVENEARDNMQSSNQTNFGGHQNSLHVNQQEAYISHGRSVDVRKMKLKILLPHSKVRTRSIGNRS